MVVMGVLGEWQGTNEERQILLDAILHYCDCDIARLAYVCPPHSLLLDERVLMHLIFVRRNIASYIGAEMAEC
jgi:hypothetical protein